MVSTDLFVFIVNVVIWLFLFLVKYLKDIASQAVYKYLRE